MKIENLDGAFFSDDVNGAIKNRSNYGNVLYQSPERLQATQSTRTMESSSRSDCWSLGVILYTLAFGRYPFYHTDLNQLKNQILTLEPTLPASLPLPIRSLLKSLLNKDPLKRISTQQLLKCDCIKSIDLIYDTDNSTPQEYCSKLINLIATIRMLIDPGSTKISKIKSMDYNLNVPIVNYSLNSKINELKSSKFVNDLNN